MRRHNADRIREITKHGRKFGMIFSWDIICGFPGEDDEDFEKTLNLARELRPEKIHAFPFSARPQTAAAAMPGKVIRRIAKERAKKIAGADFA